jgi:hypothetical protein
MASLINSLRNMLGIEPLVLYGSGTDKERAEKTCIEKYRGWSICYYYGDMHKYHDTSSEFSDMRLAAMGAYTRSEWIGNGVFVGAFNNSYSDGEFPLRGVWIRISIDRSDMKFENSPERVKAKFDKEVLHLKREIDEYISDTEKNRIQKAINEKHKQEFKQKIDKAFQYKQISSKDGE